LNPNLPVVPAARFGDLSYGLYIYGWPVEETVMWLSGGRAQWWQVFLIAVPSANVLAFLSCDPVERPMLRLQPGGPRRPGYTAAGRGGGWRRLARPFTPPLL